MLKSLCRKCLKYILNMYMYIYIQTKFDANYSLLIKDPLKLYICHTTVYRCMLSWKNSLHGTRWSRWLQCTMNITSEYRSVMVSFSFFWCHIMNVVSAMWHVMFLSPHSPTVQQNVFFTGRAVAVGLSRHNSPIVAIQLPANTSIAWGELLNFVWLKAMHSAIAYCILTSTQTAVDILIPLQ